MTAKSCLGSLAKFFTIVFVVMYFSYGQAGDTHASPLVDAQFCRDLEGSWIKRIPVYDLPMDSIIVAALGKSLDNASNEDLIGLGEKFFECRRHNPEFYGNISESYFFDEQMGPIQQLVNRMAEVRNQGRKVIASLNRYDLLLSEMRSLEVISRDRDLTDEEKLRVKTIHRDASALDVNHRRSKAGADEIESVGGKISQNEGSRAEARREVLQAERARKQSEQYPKEKSNNAELVFGMTLMLIKAEYCYKKGFSFSRSDLSILSELEARMRSEVDKNDLSLRSREQIEHGIRISGFFEMDYASLKSDCLYTRQSLVPLI